MPDSKPRIIAFYLPQFHPIPENDKWWGKGFTEWTNVGKSRPLFRGHEQPRVPADLGYYDLRIPEVRDAQAKMAQEYGIEGFCYYHYWFGNKNHTKQIMEFPLKEVVRLQKPDFPFCICWANHSFERKNWNSAINEFDHSLLVEQKYFGVEDYEEHFYELLESFKDSRYIKVDGRNLFMIYDPKNIPDFSLFKSVWNNLARKNGLDEFFFVGYYQYWDKTKFRIDESPFSLFDANAYDKLTMFQGSGKKNSITRKMRKFVALLLHKPAFLYDYRKCALSLISSECMKDNVYPVALPNSDHSPRRNVMALIFNHNSPETFKKQLLKAFDFIKKKSPEHQIVFLKSWNEWGEGNYLEPDLKYGHQYLEALRDAIYQRP